ncbi:signal peptidase I [Terriglobus saanensis]|uniref:Signal peptidase I n=1 Tax=Terriglobus saanensis (strain ATCC BAA-1853 / DSM 23119 / SP1PR4) TaxID=401053 RepID=E8UYS7_TERSS|nr:signal peptidase I [Terriglobus saanensis]ADV84293.1 signal peptidase I [Terriglobus saanensis SP1PR4]
MSEVPQHGVFPTLQSMLRATVVAVFVLTFLLQPYRIPSASMEKTLLVGDFLLVNKQALAPAGRWRWLLPYRKIQRGDVAVFYQPVTDTLLVKRVIAVGGDSVALHAGQVVLNGTPRPEGYAVYAPAARSRFRDDFPNMQERDPDTDAAWWVEMRSRVQSGALQVPGGDAFMMGDNRNNSQDSRYWGFVPETKIVGSPLLVYFSVRGDEEGTFWHRLRRLGRWRRVLSVVR